MAAALTAEFTIRFPGGAGVSAALRVAGNAAPVTVLFGPSGAGKTTVLRCLAGLERPQQGRIRFGDETWLDTERGICLPPQQRGIGLLSQEYALFPHLTVAGNVEFGVRGPRAGRPARALAILEALGLQGLTTRSPAQLSGGERQRVALARALASSPRLLLLDEPLSALDAGTRESLRRELRRVLVGCGVPTLVVTHDRLEALALGDRMAVLVDGRIRQTAAVHEVFSRPVDALVARTVGVETVVPGRVVGAVDGLLMIEVAESTLTACDPGGAPHEVLLCIRAEDVILERGAAARTSARNHFPVRVASLTPEGPLVRVTVEGPFPLAALITRPACEDLALAAGDTVTAVVKATSVHVIPRDAAGARADRPGAGA